MISLILPTRQRPNNVRRLLQSIHKTMDIEYPLEILFYIDSDDEESEDVMEEIQEKYKEYIYIDWINGPRIAHMGRMTNLLFEKSKGNIVGLIGDDVVFRTIGWNHLVSTEFSKYDDEIVYVGGDDLLNYNLFTHPFMSRKWVEVVGYLVPEFKGDYIDTFLYDVATRIGRAVRLPIVIEHLHFSNNKASMDEVMKEKLARCYSSGKPSNVEFDESKAQRDLAVEKLIKYIEDYKKCQE